MEVFKPFKYKNDHIDYTTENKLEARKCKYGQNAQQAQHIRKIIHLAINYSLEQGSAYKNRNTQKS